MSLGVGVGVGVGRRVALRVSVLQSEKCCTSELLAEFVADGSEWMRSVVLGAIFLRLRERGHLFRLCGRSTVEHYYEIERDADKAETENIAIVLVIVRSSLTCFVYMLRL